MSLAEAFQASRRGRMRLRARKTRLLVLCLAAIGALLVSGAGCNPAEVHLSAGEKKAASTGGTPAKLDSRAVDDGGDGDGDSSDDSAAGGSPNANSGEASTGGASVEESSSGGNNLGGSGSEKEHDFDGPPPPPGPEFHLEPPCLVTERCECAPEEPECRACEDFYDCRGATPFCDNSQGQCVECFGNMDCYNRFGPAFGLCSAGICVQCQTSDDCREGVLCDEGFCGSCEDDSMCVEGEHCHEGRCLIDMASF